MTRYFMAQTPLAAIEAFMMQLPKFRARCSGKRSSYRYTADECNCKYCEKAEKQGYACLTPTDCICFEERLEAGCWTFGQLAEHFAKEIVTQELSARIRRLLPIGMTSSFVGGAHKARMSSLPAAMHRDSAPNTAAAFLLSSEPKLWEKARRGLLGRAVDFSRIDPSGLCQDARLLLKAAEALYHGRFPFTLDALCDRERVSDSLFRLIAAAMVIRQYALPAKALV